MTHNIYDSDKNFIIDAISRNIRNVSTGKTTLVQYDHNSERFTFELPRFIEGHDMSLCNVVEVHYENGENKGKYLIDDLQVDGENEEIVICSWLISRHSTMFANTLTFMISFACVVDDVVEYVWNTSTYNGISITKSIYNDSIVAEQYTETIKDWENRLRTLENSVGSGGISPLINITPITNGNRVTIVDANGTKSFDIKNGVNGTSGADGKDGYTPQKNIDYFDGANGRDGIDGVSPTLTVSAISGGHKVTITDVNSTKHFNVMNGLDGQGGITSESDPNVPSWAKAPNKPTYTAEEVGAISREEVLELIANLPNAGGEASMSFNSATGVLTINEV